MSRISSRLTSSQVARLVESNSLRDDYPVAHRVLLRLAAASVRVTEIDIRVGTVWIGIALGEGANILVYSGTGTVLVQGSIYESGSYGNLLKRVLRGERVAWGSKH